MLRHCPKINATFWLAFSTCACVVKACNTPSIAALFRLGTVQKFFAIIVAFISGQCLMECRKKLLKLLTVLVCYAVMVYILTIKVY